MSYLSEENLFYLGKGGRDVSFSFLSGGGGGEVEGKEREGKGMKIEERVHRDVMKRGSRSIYRETEGKVDEVKGGIEKAERGKNQKLPIKGM